MAHHQINRSNSRGRFLLRDLRKIEQHQLQDLELLRATEPAPDFRALVEDEPGGVYRVFRRGELFPFGFVRRTELIGFPVLWLNFWYPPLTFFQTTATSRCERK